MEKIYMEENQKRQNKNKVQILLSFVIAFVAIASLVVVGFNQVSYAAEAPGVSTLSDSEEDTTIQRFTMKQKNSPARIGFGRFQVPIYYRNEDDDPVFCVEHAVAPALDHEYSLVNNTPASLTSDNDKVNLGILRLLDEKESILNANGIPNTADFKDLRQAIVQASIWKFLYESFPSSNVHALTDGSSTSLTNEQAIAELEGFGEINCFGSSCTGYQAYVAKARDAIGALVNKAKDTVSNNRSLSVNISNINLHKDGDYYLSDIIEVKDTSSTSTSTLIKYTISISGSAEGVEVLDEAKNVTTANEFAPDKKFYVRVPANKVTDSKKEIKIDVVGTFDGILTGRYYVYGDSTQKVITVVNSKTTVPASKTLEVVGAPDTGMNSVQTIYFIGLIVLLCGIGIIYANAKPVEEK